ncbi:MAG TPA: glycine oxidase ThiO [Gemmatimonadales bacterium]|nr:glycine oxidase ThiO [Gemmatimonadales bacterium]
MVKHSDVIVVGGGAAGAAATRALARAGASVTMLQPQEIPGEAWRAAAGMLAAQVETTPDDPLFKLGIAGRAFYRREAPRLLEATGIDLGLSQSGILQLALTAADEERYRAKVAWQRQRSEMAEWLTAEEVQEQWPWLAPGHGAFHAIDDGTLDPRRLVQALRADAGLAGAVTIEDEVLAILSAGGRVVGVRGAQGDHAAARVVIAAGAWSGRLGGLPRPLSVEPVRGQVSAYRWPTDVPAATVYGPRCYLLRRGEELWAGSTMEHAGFTAELSGRATDAIHERVTEIYPGLAGQTPIRSWAGLRPGTPDGRPIIGEEPRLPGLWYATGYGRNGILLSGIVGELIAQGIRGEPLPDEVAVFRPGRFWSW